MSSVAAIPVKGLEEAKMRLSPMLSPENRAALTLSMLGRVLAALRESGEIDQIWVVSPDRQVLAEVRGYGSTPMLQRSSGLNPALEEVRRAVGSGASSLLILHADLPLLVGDEVRKILEAPGSAIAPDRRLSGTNALLLRPPRALPFLFGPRSYRAYVQEAAAGDVGLQRIDAPGLAFDLDTPPDLLEFHRLESVSP